MSNQKIVFNLSETSVAVRPQISSDQVKELAFNCFGLKNDATSKLKELDSFDDRNYIIEGKLSERGNEFDETYENADKFILKIFNASFTHKQHWYENINDIITQCYQKCAPHFKLALPVYSMNGNTMSVICELPLKKDIDVIGCASLNELASKCDTLIVRDGVYYAKHIVRLSVYIPGKVVDTKTISDELALNYGKSVAMLDLALKDMTPPDIDVQEKFIWNLANAMEIYNPYVTSLVDNDRRMIVVKCLEEFSNNILPKLKSLPKQWVHGDTNEQNMLQNELNGNKKIVGILDFDDMVYSYRVVDLATSLMYITATSTRERCMDLAKQLFRGYSSIIQLNGIEMECVYNLMLCRYAQSCCISEYQYEYIDPGNEYLLLTSKTGWENMKYILSYGEARFLNFVKH